MVSNIVLESIVFQGMDYNWTI